MIKKLSFFNGVQIKNKPQMSYYYFMFKKADFRQLFIITNSEFSLNINQLLIYRMEKICHKGVAASDGQWVNKHKYFPQKVGFFSQHCFIGDRRDAGIR